MRFRATLEASGKTAAGIPVPQKVIEALGGGKRPAVTVTVLGYTFRTSIGSAGGKAMIPFSAERRAAAGVQPGQTLELEVALDTAPRVLVVPVDLKKALAKDAKARTFFETLSYSGKQRYVLPIEQAKAPETRARRVAKAVVDLRAGRK